MGRGIGRANMGSLYDSLDEFVAAAEKSRRWPSSGRVAEQRSELGGQRNKLTASV